MPVYCNHDSEPRLCNECKRVAEARAERSAAVRELEPYVRRKSGSQVNATVPLTVLKQVLRLLKEPT